MSNTPAHTTFDVVAANGSSTINAGVSAETLKLVMRHKSFVTTECYYGATREAQSAATEINIKLSGENKKSELVVGLVGGKEETPQFSAEELQKLKALLDSLKSTA